MDTTGSCSEDDHSRQPSEDGIIRSSSESDLDEHRAQLQEDGGVEEEEEEEGGEEEERGRGEVLSHALGKQNMVVTSPEAGLRLEIMQENGDTEQEDIKCFPPKK